MKKLYLALPFVLISFLNAQTLSFAATVANNAPAGYYFSAPKKPPLTLTYQYILDGTGNIVYYKNYPNDRSDDFKILPNGLMTFFQLSTTSHILMDSAFNVVDTIRAVGYTTDVHELQLLPNGNYLLLAYENTTQDLSAYNYFNHNGTAGNTAAIVKSSIIQELDSNKNVVFEWHSKDHFNFDETDPYWLNSPSTVDWIHSNAIEADSDGNILLSSRHFNEITKIDKTTGNVMWHFGGKNNDFTFTTDTIPFYGQHDIRRLSNGHITLFDDGHYTVSHGARAVEYELDEANMTAKLVWSYTYDSTIYSTSQGNVQRLANNLTLVNYGTPNKDSVSFNVVDSSGNQLFKVTYANNYMSYRSFYYSELPWELPRPNITCIDSGGKYYLQADSGYSTYSWNTGSTLRAIPVTTTGTYYVFVPYGGQGGYVSSVPFMVADTMSVCGITNSLAESKSGKRQLLYPNPAQTQITVLCTAAAKNNRPVIRNIYGAMLEVPAKMNADSSSYTLDIAMLPAGLYFVVIDNNIMKFIKE